MKCVRQVVAMLVACIGLPAAFCHAQQSPQEIDPAIAQQIAAIWAVDNHAHPVLSPPLDKTDREFDALPASSLEPQSDPVALRPDFPLLGAAWKALYGLNLNPPLNAEGIEQLKQARARIKTKEGEN